MKKSKRKNTLIILFLIIILLAACGCGAYFVYYEYTHTVNISCIVEAGDDVSASNLLMDPAKEISFVDRKELNSNIPGIYDVSVKSGLFTYDCQIIVADTTAPTGTVEPQDIVIGSTLDPMDFFTYTYDLSPVSASFKSYPDFSVLGTQDVTLELTDSSSNVSTFDTTLTIHQIDTEPPVLHGVSDFTIYVDETISYKNRFSVSDNAEEDVEFKVEGVVDTHTEGVYPMTVTATDWSGNTVSKDFSVTVIKAKYTQEEIDLAANDILSSIITDDMSEMDKLTAIYNWVVWHVGFIEHSQHDDWIEGAYDGLVNRQGDCYVYACTSKELLTRAGIENKDIHKIPTAHSSHYWNLVDIGEGWHHFDTTPRSDHPRLCYLTDQELMDYSKSHWNSHNYDREIFTEFGE